MTEQAKSWLVLLAAGQGTRLSMVTGGPKQFLDVNGVPLYWLSVRTCASVPRLAGIVLVFPAENLEEQCAKTRALAAREGVHLPLHFACGGKRRQDSVANGLRLVPEESRCVLIHDAARPFFSRELCERLLDALEQGHKAVIPGLAVTDTIKSIDDKEMVTATPARALLRAVQTPQAFDRLALCQAHEKNCTCGDADVTDDAALMESAGHAVLVCRGEERNIKITRPSDLPYLYERGVPCSGFGYDVHRYGGARPLVLCGVPISCSYSVAAHSDGDVALHALMDALLGLIGGGDIGELFPDSDPAFDGADSKELLKSVMDHLLREGVRLTHADVTIVAQTPRLAPYKEAMRSSLSTLLGLDARHVNVKATTEEKLGFTGAEQGIKAYALVSGLSR